MKVGHCSLQEYRSEAFLRIQSVHKSSWNWRFKLRLICFTVHSEGYNMLPPLLGNLCTTNMSAGGSAETMKWKDNTWSLQLFTFTVGLYSKTNIIKVLSSQRFWTHRDRESCRHKPGDGGGEVIPQLHPITSRLCAERHLKCDTFSPDSSSSRCASPGPG